VYGFGNVSVNVPAPELKDLLVTENGEYNPQDFDVYGFGNVSVNVPAPEPEKIRVSSIRINNNCLENGAWNGADKIDSKYLTTLESFAAFCYGLTENLDLSSWDVSNVISLANAFHHTGSLELDITGWNTSKVTSFANTFRGRSGNSIKIIGYENLDMSSATNVSYAFYLDIRTYKVFIWDFRKIEIPKATNVSYFFPIASSDNLLRSLVGGEDIDSVITNNTTILKGLKVSLSLTANFYCQDRASLRALINGLADMTGQAAKTLTISGSKTGGQTTSAYDTLTEDDIAVATAKNWNIVKG
jgi:surface protein